ncbi:uncharacterized protein LOC116767498 [Danaus plexippus]|uniref:uncharacterized protein LOC116767498 n=1 Tax=Danaus plexippus TaxID=13037 RepID=UPI002AB1F436|nr:uncharacterized protein LOC116767498 [Danaus plexippus]
MDPPSSNKKRTPSRCREWEKQRRIKFNDAISKLGDIVKSIHKANSHMNGEELDNANYPKIEIVQKAIICLTNIMHEKTQLKAEILALEVKLEAIEKQKQNKKDVSLQVTIGLNKKSQNNKYVKLLMLQKSKENNGKEKEKTITQKTKPKIDTNTLNKNPPKLPKLLPLTNMKKENTIVMLPATPYIFPQRPVLFPQPPTIVLVDTNLQTLNKTTTIPVINRNTNDITRTTMVNVLPISAYSRPLSALKSKKGSKAKNNSPKKGGKKTKSNDTPAENNKNEEKPDDKLNPGNNEKAVGDLKASDTETTAEINEQSNSNKELSPKEAPNLNDTSIVACETNNNLPSEETVDLNKITETPKIVEPLMDKPNNIKIAPTNLACHPENVPKTVSVDNVKCDKIPVEKTLGAEYKNKDNKLPPIIDPTICENVVDGGNARLELAEEFLAASPTAAFLMSFPLVSGNRADSPAEEANNTNAKDNRRVEIAQPVSYFDKSNTSDSKTKASIKQNVTTVQNTNKVAEQQKYESNLKNTEVKVTAPISSVTTANDNPFLNLPLPSIISSSCNLADATFGIDFDCHVTKAGTTITTSHSNSNNFMYKSEPFNAVKSTIYSTSSISSGHEFNSLGLYPCAMDNYSNKNKPDLTNVEDNLMKINSSRLTYDIDLGWSHKSFDFVNCTTSANTFHKDTILTTVSTPFSTNYNPFNPDFHVPLVPNSNKKNLISKTTTFPDQITNFYSQSGNLWSDEVSSIYTNSNVSKNFISKQQNYFPVEHLQPNVHTKTSTAKQFDTKHISESATESNLKPATAVGQVVEKYTKKSPSKMHINWMTSEIRPMQNNCNQTAAEMKETKLPYSHVEQLPKKQIPQNESNYFPINMHHFPTQANHEDVQVWPTARPAGTTEISIDPPPINLPTLIGDLALGPHDKKKADILNRSVPHSDLQNCGNFLSVTQLMNRTTENMPQRSNVLMADQKSLAAKQNLPHIVNDNRKTMTTSQTNVGYGFNDSKALNSYENINQFLQNKSKTSLKPEKNAKAHKNNYSAEALIRGGTNYNQKLQDHSSNKFMMPAQKYNDFNIQDSGVAQVSHFPSIIDYSDNSYTGQQFTGTALYNSTTNTISNSFYSNFMPGSSNLMSGNYTAAPFSSEFVDYNQTMECNYTNHKYNEVKMRNNTTAFQQDKETTNYKSSRRESAAKHKLECSKKDSNKKYQSKRPKLTNEVEEWNDSSHLLWQNKTPSKRHQNLMSDEIPFPNYVGNQMPTQYQPDFFNSHIMPSNMQGVANADRSLASFPVASRANFNLSALFPEITMKVQ